MKSLSTFACTVLCTLLGYHVFRILYRNRLARSNGHLPPRKYPHIDPFLGLDIFIKTGKLLKEHRMLPEIAQRFADHGRTFQTKNLGRTQINSIQPENIHTVFSSRSIEWGVQPIRLVAQEPFCGRGFITTDGDEWAHAKSLLKPGFQRSYISNLTSLEEHFQVMLSRIPKDESPVDLLPLFADLYLDMATVFLFGESIGALSQNVPPHALGVLAAFDYAMRGCGIRIVLGPLRFLYRDPKWSEACQKVREFADYYVERALEYRHQYLVGDNSKIPNLPNRTLLQSMAEQTGDREDLRWQIMQAHMAAQETTGNLLANVFFLLSRHPEVWHKLQQEVDAIGDSELNWDCISRLKYARMVINEALRLYPILPNIFRTALKSTSLPTGGGPDGMSPVYIPKGTMFSTSSYAIHRDPIIWGADAAEFKPERWDNNFKPGPGEYIPFGAGPRVCMGQQKALIEAGYIVVRMVQEFSAVGSHDDQEWMGQLQLTAKNAHGCVVSLKARPN
ncbi:uncharacterized protein EAF02_010277 [Botrytis sinoallii]|uniref:uncharacterized protein n=1 Tax=Botrytis sinoallii TaxID=1463999 RepID=UPI001902BB95|nr:uncharacterized protein EAF02_010277 [Botrytis sinoallii]KAF7864309.1 hypothetical protein EAF02_010277 [Botrytis sinoallii]